MFQVSQILTSSNALSVETAGWQRKDQIDYVIAKLRNQIKTNKPTRHAAISIYDAKEWRQYSKDTPCTYAVQFYILHNALNMCVVMRAH